MPEHDFERRLERLILEPESIDHLWVKLSRPFLRLWGIEPSIETKQIAAFVKAWGDGTTPPEATKLWDAAHEEFERNLTSLERARQVYGDVEPRLVNWLVRLKLVLDRTARLARANAAGEGDSNRLRALRRSLQADAHRGLALLEPFVAADPSGVHPIPIGLHKIEALLDAAQAERDFLGRRRHLLEAARELLLDASAKVKNTATVGERLEQVARGISEVDRLEAAGIDANVSLLHQLEAARATQSHQRVNAILSTLEAHAVSTGDDRVAELSQGALDTLWQGADRFLREHQVRSLAASGEQTFQPAVLEAASRGYMKARQDYVEQGRANELPKLGQYFDNIAKTYLNQQPDTELIQSALYVDGCVDVGGVLSPHRVHEPLKIVREVRHPTQQLTLAQATGIEDLKDALIGDPRTVMMDLATDRLLTRRYLGEETRHRERRVMASEVRIFLLDGSGSMLGPRARMRDAILVAELSTMIARLNDAQRWLTPTLYYRYFNENLGDVVKVSTASEAIEAVEAVLSKFRHGGTNIDGALLGSFETLSEARKVSRDELSRAQIVLITDGDAPVDEKAITAARESVEGVPIGVSIIALGEENPALRALAARQRERGERVFYQFLDDVTLTRLVAGERLSLSLHLPDELLQQAPSADLANLLDEIKAVHRARDAEALSRARDEKQALAEVGLGLLDLSKSEQARALALSRDAETLEGRFARWFPRPKAQSGVTTELELRPSEGDAATISIIQGLLFAVAEVTELVGSEALQRRVDAVEIFERLLMERRLTFLHYQKLLERYPRVFDEPLGALYRVLAVGEPHEVAASSRH
jgi:hypothetical protein